MPTLYCDFENGNDNYGGTSFALLAQGTNGRISSTTFSSTGASFPNDGSLIGQYLSIFNGSSYVTYNITAWVSATSLTIAQISGGTALANQSVDRQYYIGGRWKSLTSGATAARIVPGDTVRLMGSPAPTSLGQSGVWTSQALQSTKNITSSTNATPISVTCSAHGYSTGDTVVITGHATNTNANGTWEITVTGANTFTLDGSAGNGTGGATGTVALRNNCRVMLASAVTQNIASTGPGRVAWTSADAVNVTTGLASAYTKEHYQGDQISVAAGFTTGKAAYWATGSLDLSGYQQVSFWIQQTVGAVGAAGAIDLRLCSDTAGVTAVHTISIPNLAVLLRWTPVTVDFGANLSSNIQSIALYVNTDNGIQTFYLSNIIACKASSATDSLTLSSLIGKNTAGETWWGIQSINGRRVMLDADTSATPGSTSVRGYYGSSGTTTTWKRETIKLGPAASSTTALQQIQESGTDGNLITFSGGWDRTAMSTQNLETWLDGVNGNGYIISVPVSFCSLSGVATVRAGTGMFCGGTANIRNTLALIASNNCSVNGVNWQGNFSAVTCNHLCANAGNGLDQAVGSGGRNTYTILNATSNSGSGARMCLLPNETITGNFYNNGVYGVRLDAGSGGRMINIATVANQTGGINPNVGSTFYATNCSISETTEIENATLNFDWQVFSHDHDQTAGNHKIFAAGALISAATDQRYTASGISWKIQPTSTNRNSSWPVTLSLAKVAVAANSLVTVSAWMRRDNSGLTMRLVVKGGQIAGVPNDVVAAMTTTNAWEQETITFTPTETGVVEITAEAWGGTTFSGWVDAMAISQA